MTASADDGGRSPWWEGVPAPADGVAARHRDNGAVPTVSVVIPARDDAVELAHCLRALAAQTVAPHEVVVVDNASKDDTAAVAAHHGARVLHEPRVGIAPAAAAGYDAATGEVIARLDADSRPSADWVERVVRTFAAGPEVDAVTGRGDFHDLRGPAGAALVRVYLGAYYVLGHAAAANRVVWGSSMAMRRAAWERARERVQRDDPEVHDDMDLALVLADEWTVRYDRRLVVGVSARSLRGRAQMARRFRRAFRTLRLNWADAPPWDRWARRLGVGLSHRVPLARTSKGLFAAAVLTDRPRATPRTANLCEFGADTGRTQNRRLAHPWRRWTSRRTSVWLPVRPQED